MLNTSIKLGNTNITFNAPCTGMMQKSHPKSNFKTFPLISIEAKYIFSDYPRLNKDMKDKIIILQIMLIGDSDFLVEYVYEKYI